MSISKDQENFLNQTAAKRDERKSKKGVPQKNQKTS